MMKRTATIFLFIFIGMNVYSQCNLPYKSFDTFSNDTTAFLRYNFKDRSDCYKGKTVAQVLKDLQLSPKSYTPIPTNYKGKYKGVRIFVDNTKSYERVERENKNFQYISIYWEDLLDSEGVVKLSREYDSDKWLQRHYDFFKNHIVGRTGTLSK